MRAMGVIEFEIERSIAAQTMGSTNDMQAIADAETRRLDELSKLLGEDGLRRYQKYEATRTQHGQLSHLDTRLGPNDKLEAAQRERLIELLVKQFEWETSQKLSQSRAVLSSTLPGNLFVQDLQRSSELRTIEANQHSLRYMRESSVPMLREASAFLTPVQLQALAKMEDERTDSLRQWVEQARTQAGLDPAIPETTPTVDSNPPLRKPVSGDIRLGIRMTVDRSDGVTVSLDGRNGEPRSFEVAEGLIVEAIPTLFDDDWLDVKFNFYEKDAQGQRRRLPSSTGIGRPRALDANPSVYDGMSSTVVHGRKAYAVTTRVRVERV